MVVLIHGGGEPLEPKRTVSQMNLSHSNSIRYGIMNALTGEFFAKSTKQPWTTNVFETQFVMNREQAAKLRTQVRAQFGEIPAVAIDIVRVRADVRRGSLGRPRKVA